MIKNALLLIAAAIICQGFTFQTTETAKKTEEKTVTSPDSAGQKMNPGEAAVLQGKNSESKTSRNTGNSKLDLLESLEEENNGDLKTTYEIIEDKNSEREQSESYSVRKFEAFHNWDRDEERDDNYRPAMHFRGHWSGIEVGINNFAYSRSMTLPEDIAYMAVDANHSVGLNINFSQLSVGFSRHIGIVTGFGLTWNNYRFNEGNSIEIGEDGLIGPVFYSGVTPPVKRSKFSDLYLNIPAMLEIQLPAGFGNHLNIAAGVIGGLKLNSWTKVIFEDGEKSKANGDYNLNLLRGGVTARVGYQNFMLYGTYYLTPWFQDLKGPNGLNLEPFEIGVAFTFND